MENNISETIDTSNTANVEKRNKIGLPIIALILDLMPFILIFILFLLSALPNLPALVFGLILLGILFSPIAGIMLGVISLSQWGIGKVRILSIIAILLPITYVTTFILLIRTGAISIGM
jgi:hypothetical protein